MAKRVVTIREATPLDATEILGMVAHFLEASAYGQVLDFKPEPLLALINALVARGQGVILVAEASDHALAGMLAAYAAPHPATGQLTSDELAWWVEPYYRKTFAGPLLLSAYETWSKARGVKLVKMVAPYGSSIGEYYTRIGYVPLETAYVKVLP